MNPDFRVALDAEDVLQAGADTIVAELMVLHGGAKAVIGPFTRGGSRGCPEQVALAIPVV